MIKFAIAVFILLSSVYTGTGQLLYSLDDDTAHIAKVENILHKTISDSVKAYTSLKLSIICKLINDTVKSKSYLKQGIELSEKYPFLKAASYFYKAHALYEKRNIPAIEHHLMKGDSLLASFMHTEAFKLRGYIWHAFGIFQQIKGNEKAAMDAFINKALVYAKRSGDPFLQGNINKAIAIVFMNADQRPKAPDTCEQPLSIWKVQAATTLHGWKT